MSTVFFILLFFLLGWNPFLLMVEGQCASLDCREKTPPTMETDFGTSCNQMNIANCSGAWSGFSGAFSGKMLQYTVNASDYQPYFDVIPVVAGPNQSLFWSHTFNIVEQVSSNTQGVTVVSSTNTPSGAVANSIGPTAYWCGNASGIDYTNYCLCNVTNQFWIQFSINFAQAARATDYWLGDGERPGGAYQSSSCFGSVELPNMTASAVNEVVVLLVHREGYGESCNDTTGNSSIVSLRNDITRRNFGFDCYDIDGQVSDPSQTSTIAGCVTQLIGEIQQGMRPSDHHVRCSGGMSAVISTFSVFIMLTIAVLTSIN